MGEQRHGSGFRRDGKAAHQDSQKWDDWRTRHAELITACGLPFQFFEVKRIGSIFWSMVFIVVEPGPILTSLSMN